MSTMIPIIWVVELDLLHGRINKPSEETDNNPNATTIQPPTTLPPPPGVSTLIAWVKLVQNKDCC